MEKGSSGTSLRKLLQELVVLGLEAVGTGSIPVGNTSLNWLKMSDLVEKKPSGKNKIRTLRDVLECAKMT
jgi:hypothetical protein